MSSYQQVARRIVNLIENGVLRNGDKIPSLRQLSQELNVSVGTVREAYWKLENDRYISAIPQSGYYVQGRPTSELLKTKDVDLVEIDPKEVSLCRIYGSLQEKHQITPEISLGVATMSPEEYPTDKLNRYIHAALKSKSEAAMDYMMPPGYLPLREQISRHSLSSGKEFSPDEIIITNGCHEAAFLSLMALCRAGDTIAIESPVYFNFLSLLESLGLKVVEIPMQKDGMNLDVLKFVLENHDIKALFSITNFNNPTGTTLSNNKKQELLNLLNEYDVPLIEDDIYGELGFNERPRTCKSYDTEDNVILCSSFSKTLTPGFRIGWLAPGKYYDQIVHLKTLLNVGTSSLGQIALASYLKEGGFERHLRKVRKRLHENMGYAIKVVNDSFPDGTRVSEPEGGFVLWVTLPEHVDTGEIYYRALQEGILIAPGCLFTQKEKYNSSMRLNFGMWQDRTEKAVKRLGEMARNLPDKRFCSGSKRFKGKIE